MWEDVVCGGKHGSTTMKFTAWNEQNGDLRSIDAAFTLYTTNSLLKEYQSKPRLIINAYVNSQLISTE